MKFALNALLIGLVLWWLVRALRKMSALGNSKTSAKETPPPPGAAADPRLMLRCAHCGLHLPASDALRLGDAVYCSEAHKRLGPQP